MGESSKNHWNANGGDPKEETLKPAERPSRTLELVGCERIPGETKGTVSPAPPPEKRSALAMSRPPSVCASQKSPRTSVDGGKKLRATTERSPAGLTPTSGCPLLQCAITVEPGSTVMGELW